MNKLGYILLLAVIGSGLANAQETQRLTANKLNEYGLIYSLPKTHLNIEVEAVKTIKKAGPFYKYAKKYLGATNIVTADAQSWDIKNIAISTFGVADKEEEYLMQFKSGSSPYLIIDSEGLPLAINAEVTPAKNTHRQNQIAEPTPLDGNTLNVFSEDMIAGESTMKRAEAAAAKIFELRETRNDLVSGNADQMPPDGESLKLMLDELNRQESILTAMFVGVTTTETIVSRFDYTPTEDITNEVIFRISDYNGVVDASDLSGEPVYLTISTTAKGELPVNEKGEVKEAPKGAVMYCIPGKANVALNYNGKRIVSKDIEVAQFGVKFGLNPKLFTDKKAPAYVIYNPDTGAILKMGTTTTTTE